MIPREGVERIEPVVVVVVAVVPKVIPREGVERTSTVGRSMALA